jgi:hypothetical protein
MASFHAMEIPVPLSRISCEGFKKFHNSTNLETKRLTVIFGKNGSGKTTLVRFPIFAAASLTNTQKLYSLHYRDLRFAASFEDLASVYQAHPTITFGLHWSPSRSIELRLQRVLSDRYSSIQVSGIQLDGGDFIPFRLQPSEDDSTFASISEAIPTESATRLAVHRKRLSRLLGRTIHIGSARPSIEATYPMQDTASWTVSGVPSLLATRPSLMSFVTEWFYGNLDGTRINLDIAPFAYRFTQEHRYSQVSLSESGRGTQSLLPVVTLLIGIAHDLKQTDLAIVEEPEEHLHPSAHGAVADLLVEASKKAQVFVETHSENLILRLRRRVAEGRIKLTDLALYYIDQQGEVISIDLDSTGSALNWPAGVFENDIEEAQAIIDAKIAALGASK